MQITKIKLKRFRAFKDVRIRNIPNFAVIIGAKFIEAGKPATTVRIACRELKSWHFEELEAVEKAFGLANLGRDTKSKQYRISDRITKPSVELTKITNKKYQKISGSREIGKCLSTEAEKNASISYNHFISGLNRALASLYV